MGGHSGRQPCNQASLIDLDLFKNRRFALATLAFTVVGFASVSPYATPG